MSRMSAVFAGRPRDFVTDVVLTLVSMVVLVVLALYVVAPPVPTMALDVTSTAAASSAATVYGIVFEGDEKPVRGATIVVSRQTPTGLVRVLSMTADESGGFSGEVPAPSGTYRITVSADVGGRTARDTTTLVLEPGRTYGIRAELIVRDYFIFLPLPTY